MHGGFQLYEERIWYTIGWRKKTSILFFILWFANSRRVNIPRCVPLLLYFPLVLVVFCRGRPRFHRFVFFFFGLIRSNIEIRMKVSAVFFEWWSEMISKTYRISIKKSRSYSRIEKKNLTTICNHASIIISMTLSAIHFHSMERILVERRNRVEKRSDGTRRRCWVIK